MNLYEEKQAELSSFWKCDLQLYGIIYYLTSNKESMQSAFKVYHNFFFQILILQPDFLQQQD